jgi:hypothetical protein
MQNNTIEIEKLICIFLSYFLYVKPDNMYIVPNVMTEGSPMSGILALMSFIEIVITRTNNDNSVMW